MQSAPKITMSHNILHLFLMQRKRLIPTSFQKFLSTLAEAFEVFKEKKWTKDAPPGLNWKK